MSEKRDYDRSYVDKVRQCTREYVESLLEEVERARKLLVAQEREISCAREEKLKLQGQLLDLREELDLRNTEQMRLQRELMEIEGRNRRYSDEYLIVEQQNANLANLYVASYRLHATLERDEVLAAITEIVINMIGSEEVGVFELRDGVLELIGSIGIDEKKYARVEIGKGPIGEAVAAGRLFAANGPVAGHGDGLTACIPLEVKGRAVGAVAVFGLLEQKSGLEALDFELFELLRTHASTALYATRLHTDSKDAFEKLPKVG